MHVPDEQVKSQPPAGHAGEQGPASLPAAQAQPASGAAWAPQGGQSRSLGGVGARVARRAVGEEAGLVEHGGALRVVGGRQRCLAVLQVEGLLARIAHQAELRARVAVTRRREVPASHGGRRHEDGGGDEAVKAEGAHASLL